MSEDGITIEFTCTKCGGSTLTVPDENSDDAIASCKDCGQAFGRWGDIKAKAMDAAFVEAAKVARASMKGIGKGWKRK